MTSYAPPPDELNTLCGTTLVPSARDEVSYTVGAITRSDASTVWFDASRVCPDGESFTSIRALRPSIVHRAGSAVTRAMAMEAAKLGRLEELSPPSPFVLRVLDSGAVPIDFEGDTVVVPWYAAEGIFDAGEGASLADRVTASIRASGYSFEPQRFVALVEALAEGLAAIHSVGVIHRDLSPASVVGFGTGDLEVFKIRDFGVPWPDELANTVGTFRFGVPGYAAPEQTANGRIGPWTDIFALACVLFYTLAGEPLLELRPALDDQPRRYERRSLLNVTYLHPWFASRPEACLALDGIFARATSPNVEDRPLTAKTLVSSMLPWVRQEPNRAGQGRSSVVSPNPETPWDEANSKWIVRNRCGGRRIIRSAAWSGDASCLVATDRGLGHWDGVRWADIPTLGLPDSLGIHFVQQVSPGKWLVGGDHAILATFTGAGVRHVSAGADDSLRVEHASGDVDDLAVMVTTAPDTPPTLLAISARRWMKPLHLDGVAKISGVARVGDDRWLLAGRTTNGHAYAALYEPMMWSVRELSVAQTRAFLAVAALPNRGVGVLGGTHGSLTWFEGDREVLETIDGESTISALALDPTGRGWAAAVGKLWTRDRRAHSRWTLVWEDRRWSSPIVSLFADVGRVVALAADGGVLEGLSATLYSRTASS